MVRDLADLVLGVRIPPFLDFGSRCNKSFVTFGTREHTCGHSNRACIPTIGGQSELRRAPIFQSLNCFRVLASVDILVRVEEEPPFSSTKAPSQQSVEHVYVGLSHKILPLVDDERVVLLALAAK